MKLATIHNILTYRTLYKQFTCAALVIAADILFYNHHIGWTIGLFGALLLFALYTHNNIWKNPNSKIAFCAASGLIFSLIETPTILGVAMYAVTISACALLTRNSVVADAKSFAADILAYVFRSSTRLYRDSLIIAHVRKRVHLKLGNNNALVRNWLLPAGFSVIFITLFAQANPIITNWIGNINWGMMSEYMSIRRIIFWMLLAFACWSVIRPKTKPNKTPQRSGSLSVNQFTFTSLIFNERSIFTSLILFNGLFLLQNIMDVVFLWSNVTLPEGMSYAEYAHQGAYPLMATALLAALFVLIALKPGSLTESMPTIRALVYAWVGQNVFLVVSAMLRLAGYVEQYSLTWLRIAAFIWMTLVALGLMLIIARIYFEKSNLWLINSNSAALYVTLYLCCFINFGGIIADYNVRHCTMIGNAQCHLDVWYLRTMIGVEALPALREFENSPAANKAFVANLRTDLEASLQYSLKDWRQWTFRNWRLAQAY